jgi:hypothetical protein
MTTRAEIAYETAKQSLTDQRQLLTDLRGRAAIVLSAAAVVASFLGAQALTATNATTAPTSTTTTASATTTTPGSTTATTHGITTEINESGKTERLHGTAIVTTHGGAVAITHGTSTARPSTPATGIHLSLLESLALISLVVLAVLCILVLWPWKWTNWHFNAETLVTNWVLPGGPVDRMHWKLAKLYEDTYQKNKKKLDWLFLSFRVGCGLLIVQVVFWILAVAKR